MIYINQLIQYVFKLANSNIPSGPHSLPKPLDLTPPTGILLSLLTKSLMNTMPASICVPNF